MESLTRLMHEHLNRDELEYTICEENTTQAGLETAIVAISNQRNICFHTAWTNGDVEDAKDICAQAVLYRSTPRCPHLYYAVYNSRTRTFYFCLLDPNEQEHTDVATYSLEHQEERMLAALETYVTSNAQVLE
jgi:spore germination protein YaaH